MRVMSAWFLIVQCHRGTSSAHYLGPTHFIMRRMKFSIEVWFSPAVSIKLCAGCQRWYVSKIHNSGTCQNCKHWPDLAISSGHPCDESWRGLQRWLIKICDVTNGDQSRAGQPGHIVVEGPGNINPGYFSPIRLGLHNVTDAEQCLGHAESVPEPQIISTS